MFVQEVMPSYFRPCSDEIGGFCELRIWVGVIAFWSVFFCIAGSIIGGCGYLGAIYSFPEVKVTQGHDCYGPFPQLILAVIILSFTSCPETPGHCLEQN